MSSPDIRDRSRRWPRGIVGCLILATLASTAAADARYESPDADARCVPEAVHDHVREQFARFVPLSSDREYFGFIYLLDGRISSTVVRGHECRAGDRCVVSITDAARAATGTFPATRRTTALRSARSTPGTSTRAR